ncbi:MAG: hypothetical protein ACO2PP_08765 [Thermocrinis sp.]|jgi:hypothetical protein|uniref:hypothetical protein n=1 Tax=Thermocrinis sp. TaxID=2024383 RepID=UPI003C0FAE69
MLVQTGYLNFREGEVRLQFFSYPEKGVEVPAGRVKFVKQKLWLSAGDFRRSLWLSCESAFLLYLFLHRFVLSGTQEEFFLADDVSILRFQRVEGSKKAVLSLIVESKDGRGSGKLLLDYDDVVAFMSFLKGSALLCVIVAGQRETVWFQRWKDHFLILQPITSTLSLQKVKKARLLLKGEYQKPVVFKDLYSFKPIPQEGILLTTPNENIKLSQEQVQKLALFFE